MVKADAMRPGDLVPGRGGQHLPPPEGGGEPRGMEKVCGEKTARGPAAAAFTPQLEPAPLRAGEGRVCSQGSQRWPGMPGKLCSGIKSSFNIAEKGAPAEAEPAGWE